jgi:hypothetical protein
MDMRSTLQRKHIYGSALPSRPSPSAGCGAHAAPARLPRGAARAVNEDLGRRRQAIAQAVFERIDVLGVTDYTFTLTAPPKARGWDAAFGAGVVRAKEGRSGRGERSQPSGTDLFVPVTWGLPCRVTGPAALSGAAG